MRRQRRETIFLNKKIMEFMKRYHPADEIVLAKFFKRKAQMLRDNTRAILMVTKSPGVVPIYCIYIFYNDRLTISIPLSFDLLERRIEYEAKYIEQSLRYTSTVEYFTDK